MREIQKPKPFPFAKQLPLCREAHNLQIVLLRYNVECRNINGKLTYYPTNIGDKHPIAEYDLDYSVLVLNSDLHAMVSDYIFLLYSNERWVTPTTVIDINLLFHSLNLLGTAFTINNVIIADRKCRRRWRKLYRQYLKPSNRGKLGSASF